MPYREQLLRKSESMKSECLIPLLKGIKQSYHGELPVWLSGHRESKTFPYTPSVSSRASARYMDEKAMLRFPLKSGTFDIVAFLSDLKA